MILYLLKSSAVLLVVLLFYKVFLEKEKAFVFNRSYLWLGLIFSFLSPLLVYEIPVDWTLVQEAEVLGEWAKGVQKVQYTERLLKEEQATIDWFYLGSLVYIFLCGILMIRFIVNLSKMLYRVHSSEHRKEGKYRIVSNETIEAPFSFFNTIFLPENYDRSILEHEKRHADAYHSFDVIVLELIQIVFWINPLIFWHKRLISLNHEFFADYQENASNIKTYQKLIFSHISKNKDNLLASGFNYSFIKKRMIMLQRSRSGPLLWAKKVMVIPFFAILAFAACEKVEAQESIKSNKDLPTESKLIVQFDGKSTNDIKVLSAKDNRILDNDDFTKLVLSQGLLAFDQVNFQVGNSVYKGKELHRIVFTKEKEELFVRKLDKNSSVIKVTTGEGRENKKYRAIRLGPGENWSASYNGNEVPPPPPPPVAPPSPEKSASFENIPPPPPPVHPANSKAAPMSEPAPPQAPEPAAEPSPVPPPPPPSGWVKEPKTPKTPKVPKTPKAAKEPKAPKSPKPPKPLKNEKIEKEIIKLKYEIESLYNEKSKNKEKQEQLKLKQTQLKQLQEKLKQIK